MQIASDKVVTIHYTLTDNEGLELDSSDGDDPLIYLQGQGSIVPGLERALEGLSAGDEFTITMPAADGYGERDDKLVQAVPRKNFPPGEMEIGMRFETDAEDGGHILTVVAVNKDSVTVDANHPLAGVALTFAVKVVSVRESTAEEREHGHIHGEDGHHHH